eukprot:gene5687-33037_t
MFGAKKKSKMRALLDSPSTPSISSTTIPIHAKTKTGTLNATFDPRRSDDEDEEGEHMFKEDDDLQAHLDAPLELKLGGVEMKFEN